MLQSTPNFKQQNMASLPSFEIFILVSTVPNHPMGETRPSQICIKHLESLAQCLSNTPNFMKIGPVVQNIGSTVGQQSQNLGGMYLPYC